VLRRRRHSTDSRRAIGVLVEADLYPGDLVVSDLGDVVRSGRGRVGAGEGEHLR
jgi:hypothetical protein